MPFIYVLLTLIVVGLCARFINTYAPTTQNVKKVLNVVMSLIVVGMILWMIDNYIPMAGSIKQF